MRIRLIVLLMMLVTASMIPSLLDAWKVNLVNYNLVQILARDNFNLFDLLAPEDWEPNRLAVAAQAKWILPANLDQSKSSCSMMRVVSRLELVSEPNNRLASSLSIPVTCLDSMTAFQQSLDNARKGEWAKSLDLIQSLPVWATDTWINHLRLARHFAAMGQWVTSIEEYRITMSSMRTRSALVFEEYARATASFMETTQCPLGETWRCLYRRARSYWKLGEWQSARQAYQLLISTLPESQVGRERILAEAYDRIGQDAERIGEDEMALRLYEQAWQKGRREVDLYVKLKRAYASVNDTSKLDHIDQEAAEWQPPYLLSNSTTLLGSGDWVLVGYQFNQDDLEWGGSVEVSFFWRNDDPAQIPKGSQWTAMGDKWVLRQEAQNLVPNGSFTWSTKCRAYPCGISPIYSTARPLASEQVYQGTGDDNRYLSLLGSSVWHDSFVGTRSMPINRAGSQFLQSARVRGSEAVLAVGVLFIGEGQFEPWQFIASEMSSEDWTRVSGILLSPEWARILRVALSNWRGNGAADFDDLILVKLPLPEPN